MNKKKNNNKYAFNNNNDKNNQGIKKDIFNWESILHQIRIIIKKRKNPYSNASELFKFKNGAIILLQVYWL